MIIPSRFECAAALVLFCASSVSMQGSGATITAGDDSKTITELLTREEAAWNRDDAEGFAEQNGGEFCEIVQAPFQ